MFDIIVEHVSFMSLLIIAFVLVLLFKADVAFNKPDTVT